MSDPDCVHTHTISFLFPKKTFSLMQFEFLVWLKPRVNVQVDLIHICFPAVIYSSNLCNMCTAAEHVMVKP